MAEYKINIDMSELDAAIKRAESLSEMLDDIERRISDIMVDCNGFRQIIASAPNSPPPPKSTR